MSPGSMPLAREIYQEGLRIPPILLVRGGKIDRELLDLVLANVRTPVEREGDLMAQLASLTRGAERTQRPHGQEHGLETVNTNMRALQDYSERMMRAAILQTCGWRVSALKIGLDSDGVSPEPLWIRAAIIIRGDSAVVDFTGTDAQAQGPMNANYAVTLAAVMYVFRCLIQEDVPSSQRVSCVPFAW